MDIGAMMSKETLKIMVTKTLEAVEQTRNDDIVLTTEVWKRYYPEYLRIDALGNQFVYLRSLNLLPREDNVKRIRAKLQNEENKFLPTDEKVREQRKISEEQWREYLGYKPKAEQPKAINWAQDDE